MDSGQWQAFLDEVECERSSPFPNSIQLKDIIATMAAEVGCLRERIAELERKEAGNGK
jgi:hypothetical protein